MRKGDAREHEAAGTERPDDLPTGWGTACKDHVEMAACEATATATLAVVNLPGARYRLTAQEAVTCRSGGGAQRAVPPLVRPRTCDCPTAGRGGLFHQGLGTAGWNDAYFRTTSNTNATSGLGIYLSPCSTGLLVGNG